MSALADLPTTCRTTRVFVVEDSEVIRKRLVSMLTGLAGVELIGHAESAADAIARILSQKPDVVVLDIKLTAGSGIEVLRTIKHRIPGVVVIMLTNYASAQYRSKCLEAGAEYFLDKTNEFEKLLPIIVQLKRSHA